MGLEMVKVSGGYYIKARKIMDSKIMRSPPVVRELWDFLIMSARFKDADNGNIKRGQLLTTTNDIIDGLSWYVGYSKRGYSEKQIRSAMKVLAQGGMLVTAKVTNGTLITICNYSLYQDFNSYEGNRVGNCAGQAQVNNYKEKEGEKEEKKKNKTDFVFPDCIPKKEWNDFKEHRGKKFTEKAQELALKQLEGWHKEGHDIKTIIEKSIMNGWSGLFAPKESNNQNGEKNGKLSQNSVTRVQRTKPVTPEQFAALCNPDLS